MGVDIDIFPTTETDCGIADEYFVANHYSGEVLHCYVKCDELGSIVEINKYNVICGQKYIIQ